MPKLWLWKGRSNGFNEIFEITEEVATRPGIYKFKEVLKEVDQTATHELILELVQVFKIPWKQLAELSDSDFGKNNGCGYVDYATAEDLKSYLTEVRLLPVQLRFLQRQSGEAGIANDKPLYEPGEDFKDRCG